MKIDKNILIHYHSQKSPYWSLDLLLNIIIRDFINILWCHSTSDKTFIRFETWFNLTLYIYWYTWRMQHCAEATLPNRDMTRELYNILSTPYMRPDIWRLLLLACWFSGTCRNSSETLKFAVIYSIPYISVDFVRSLRLWRNNICQKMCIFLSQSCPTHEVDW